MKLINKVRRATRKHYAKKVDKLMEELVNCKDSHRVAEIKTQIKDYHS